MSARDGREALAVFAGGGLGALARTGLADGHPHSPGAWPWVTLSINIVGAFMLGFVLTRILPGPDGQPSGGHLLLGTGFCGALTTFSAMQLELLQMLDDGALVRAGTYIAAAVTAGYLAVGAGSTLGRRRRHRRRRRVDA